MNECPVCTSTRIFPFVQRERVPVTQNLLVPTQTAAREVCRGDLEICCCEDCGFAFNRTFDAGLLGYGDEYDNTQSHSPSFKSYMDDLVSRLLDRRGIRNSRIVEVGCGKGYFIRELIGRTGANNMGWGFDPSYIGPETDLDGKLIFKREYYGPGSEEIRADVVVCRHVIEHISNPFDLLCTVRAALAQSPDARVFFETPSLAWILENLVVWDFFYEHCSLFTPASLTTLFERAGFRVTEVETTFGGQYMWLEARVADAAPAPSRHPGDIPDLARRFHKEEQRWLEQWKQKLHATDGKVAIWGGGAKGVTFANLADPACELIDCVVDLNPNKQNHFLPGTGHPIVAPAALGERGIKTAINMNPNYREENLRLLASSGLDIALEDQTL